MTATIEDSSGNIIDSTYYRYYTPSDPDFANGYRNGLKMVFNAQSFARLQAAVPGYAGAPDSTVLPYADQYFVYGGDHQVAREVVQGAGCSRDPSCTGQGTYTFGYFYRGSASPNSWDTKTTEIFLDVNGATVSTTITYTNSSGQVMLSDFFSPTSDANHQHWVDYYRYDSFGALVLHANPSAIKPDSSWNYYSESYDDLINYSDTTHTQYLNQTAGLIEKTVHGYQEYVLETDLQQGQTGAVVPQSTTVLDTTHPVIDPMTETTFGLDYGTQPNPYPDRDPRATNYSYGFYTGTSQMQWMKVTKPLIVYGQNGPALSSTDTANADVEMTYYDPYGREIWFRDADGHVKYTAYDPATGAVVKTITDVNYSQLTSTEKASFDATMWTPQPSGQPLVTTMVVDTLGRTLLETDPNGNNTAIVYLDSNRETRTYPGWNTTSHTTTGPISVQREYRPAPNAPVGQRTLYEESITASVAAPTFDSTTNLPTGLEAINETNIQSLSRQLTSNGGQNTESDAYFSLTGITYNAAALATAQLGAAGVNYNATLTDYDVKGRQNRTVKPTGTIDRTVYDDLGRVSSTWVGTADTPPTVTQVSLSGAFNTTGITADGASFGLGLDGAGHAYSASAVGSPTVNWNAIPFALGPTGSADAISATGQTINLPAANGTAIEFLATGVNGNQGPLNFVVTYTDLSTQTYSQSFSDWLTPQIFGGEGIAAGMSYRNNSNGTQDSRPVYLYGYDFPLNPAKQVQSIHLPNNSSVMLLAMDVTSQWSPTNNGGASNLVQVSGNVYDGSVANGNADTGGVGDGNLTRAKQFPDSNASDARITDSYFDWRDRLIASKSGATNNPATEDTTTHRQIAFGTLDNLGEATQQQQYNGDGWIPSVNSDGTVTIPGADAGQLRSQVGNQYDDQGRIFETDTYWVDQSSGAVGAHYLQSFSWYSHRGQLIKTQQPGGLIQKTTYDGAGRQSIVYSTDGAYDVAAKTSGTWTSATNVLGNNVFTQTETQYDSASNPIFVIIRERFNDNPLTAQGFSGALGNPGQTPFARVSYTASYYDAANRKTNDVDFGTDGGMVLSSRPPLPGSSDPALKTAYTYAADTVQTVTVSGNPTGGSFTLTVGGQTTSAINYPFTTAAVQTAIQGALNALGTGRVAQVAGPNNGPWAVRFVGTTLAGTPFPIMTANSSLTGGSVSVSLTSQGGDAGRVQQSTDPLGLVSKTDYDLLGRTIRTDNDYVNFAPALAGMQTPASDQTVEYSYDGSGHQLTVQADLPALPTAQNMTYQITQYIYGTTGGGGTNSDVYSNDLLAKMYYPDPTTGLPSSAQQEVYTVNALGQNKTKKERNFNTAQNQPQTHVYSYDVLGRQTADTVTVLGDNVDGTVVQLATAYDTGGRPYQFTSYGPNSTLVNQGTDQFNGFGQLTQETQNHVSASQNVSYGYSFDPNNASGPNNSRMVSMTYPSQRQINYLYGTAGSLDDTISRLTGLADNGAGFDLEDLTYVGLGTVVQRLHPQTGINLTYINTPNGGTDGGDKYNGLDRFGRVVAQYWFGNSTATDNFTYSYDRDSNRLSRTNILAPSFNETYGYDSFNQLTSFTQGSSHTQTWNLDPLGNWDTFTNNGVQQSRSNNAQNEITGIQGQTTPGYDANGNTNIDQQGHGLVYDAWNRLVQFKTSPTGTALASYSYDALGRRIQETHGTAVTDLYFSSQWQVIEEDHSLTPSQVPPTTYVWSPVYVDALVERDGPARLYVQQDANYNVTAVIGLNGGSWQPLERYVYDPYGAVAFYAGDWSNPSSASSQGWIYLHQGGRYDAATGLYNFRHRDYSPVLGRWMENDPIGYTAGDPDLYRFENSSPQTKLDASGTYFIAVADRPVDNTLGAYYHYSIELWYSWCWPTKETKISTFLARHPKAFKKDSFELLNVPGYKAHIYKTLIDVSQPAPFPDYSFYKPPAESVGVSWVHEADPGATNFVSVYGEPKYHRKGPQDDSVLTKWAKISAEAKAYKYAEHGVNGNGEFDGKFKNWPNSRYIISTGATNSNTFVRYLVHQAGISMIELGGSHPGAWPPAGQDRRYYDGNPFRD